MAYRLIEVQSTPFPSARHCESALGVAGLSILEMTSTIQSFVCPVENHVGIGYQVAVARQLQRYLGEKLVKDGIRSFADARYSQQLNEVADVAIEVRAARKRIYIEIEFRPNVEKDLIKFQIGWNTGRLLAGVLVVAIDRKALNTGYTSMPEYKKFVRVIRELRPTYPLLLVGIRGAHLDAPVK